MTPVSNKQTRLIVILIIFVGLVSGYVYYTRFATLDDQGLPLLPDYSKDNLGQFKNIRFDFKLLDSSTIRSLKFFGESPIKPDLTGKNNPFSTF